MKCSTHQMLLSLIIRAAIKKFHQKKKQKNTALATMVSNEKKLAHLECCTCPEGCYKLQTPQAMYYRDC